MKNRLPILKIDKLSASYGDNLVLEDVSLTVYDHDFLGVIGPNGGGKTTLMKILLGMKNPLSGNISFFREGQRVNEITMGYLPQYNDIDKSFPISVYEVVLSGLSHQKRFLRSYTKFQHQQVEDTINKMGLTGMEKRAIGNLSGGQLQRVLLARAIVSKPEVIILDEPNTYIDKQFQEQMYNTLDKINKDCAIIMVSHDVGSILQNVKNVACVNRHLHYHDSTKIPISELHEHFGCTIEILGHGDMPHRVLKKHED